MVIYGRNEHRQIAKFYNCLFETAEGWLIEKG
jgi:hypothetical protein